MAGGYLPVDTPPGTAPLPLGSAPPAPKPSAPTKPSPPALKAKSKAPGAKKASGRKLTLRRRSS